MNDSFVTIQAIEGATQCEDGLRLRQRLAKLRWLRLNAEADQLAEKIAKLDCDLPRRLSPRISATD